MRKVVISGMLGNGLEWYDFAIYGQLAFILSHLFFPSENQTAQLLATFGVFAVGFIFRPLGAVLFGWIGDTYGRKAALVSAILLMAIPTGCIGLLPTYEQIGMLAPILLTLIRMCQGLSLGGEFSGSIAYIVEHAPPQKRGLAGSASVASLVVGFMFGSLTAYLIKTTMPQEAFEAWGWRIPFLVGVVIGLVGMYIRSRCGESPVYEQAKAEGHLSKTPVKEAFTRYPIPMLQAFTLYLAVTMPFYLVSIYMITYMQTQLGLSAQAALLINTAAMGAMLAGMLVGALACDHVGRKPVMMAAASAMLIAAFPVFIWMDGGVFLHILAAQCFFALLLGVYIGPVPAILVEMFPTRVRFTGMALAYNASATLFGGTAPMVCVWLISVTGTHLSIAAYVMLCCVLSLVALATYHDRWREGLA